MHNRGMWGKGLLRRAPSVQRRTGVSATGMEYEVLGDGPRTLLYIPGGPGSELPRGRTAGLANRRYAPFVRAGYTVWVVTRRRRMPPGHTVADMADDHARFIEEQLGGYADLVVGESYGGMIAQYLAADHPRLVGRVVLALAAATITDHGKDMDVRWAMARAEGRHADAGAAALELFLPGERLARLRRLLGPLAGRMFAGSAVRSQDLVVEARAEEAFDAREVIGRIQCPVLILCGDQDEFFSREAVEETARGISGATVILYPGKNHARAAMSHRITPDVLAWAGAAGSP